MGIVRGIAKVKWTVMVLIVVAEVELKVDNIGWTIKRFFIVYPISVRTVARIVEVEHVRRTVMELIVVDVQTR